MIARLRAWHALSGNCVESRYCIPRRYGGSFALMTLDPASGTLSYAIPPDLLEKHTGRSRAILFSASLPTSVFMTPAYGPGSPFGELKVTRRTGVLRGGPGRCGLVLGAVRKAACADSAKEGHVFLSFRKARHRTNPEHHSAASGTTYPVVPGRCQQRALGGRVYFEDVRFGSLEP